MVEKKIRIMNWIRIRLSEKIRLRFYIPAGERISSILRIILTSWVASWIWDFLLWRVSMTDCSFISEEPSSMQFTPRAGFFSDTYNNNELIKKNFAVFIVNLLSKIKSRVGISLSSVLATFLKSKNRLFKHNFSVLTSNKPYLWVTWVAEKKLGQI